MRLYLSSQGLGSAAEELVSLLDGGTRIAVVANGAYLDDPAKQRRRVECEVTELRELGLDPAEIDLRDYFGRKEALRSELDEFHALWVLGGNVVVLRTAFSASGADDIVRNRLAGAAGANLLTHYFIDNHIPFIALRDGQAVVVDGDNMRVAGQYAAADPVSH